MSSLTPVLTDASQIRQRIHDKTLQALTSTFPLDLKGRTLEVKDLHILKKEYSPEEQKKALLTGGTLLEPVKGTLVLRGGDGKIVDTAKNFTLVHLPYFTERHTLIAEGNEYQVANMLRRKPGVYTQRAENGELHTTFNLSKGKNFDIGLNPQKGTLYLQYGASNIPLYPVLRSLGVSHEDIAKHWGSGVAANNKNEHGHQVESAIGKLYAKLEHPAVFNAKALHVQKLDSVKKRLEATAIDPEVVEHTLGQPHDKVTSHALLQASQKLLQVHEGKKDIDDADSLAFKSFHSLDDFLSERIKLTARTWAPKARFAFVGKNGIREALRPAPFSNSVRKWVTTSQLSSVPTGINPMELIDHAVKVTSLGEGGIPSERAIPYEARMTHSTHFGVLDPIRTPESNHAGVDVRATILSHRDDRGNLYTPFLDTKTGKQVLLKAGDLMHHTVAFPHQELRGQVAAFVKGKVQKIDAKKVDYQALHLAQIYSPATTLIPMIHNIQGNRAIMGSKMGTQALPLLEREPPLVQVQSHQPGHSFEELYGHMIVPRATVSGKIKKIEDGWIYIEPGQKKTGNVNDDPPCSTEDEEPLTKEAAAALVKVPFQTNFPFPSKTYLHHTLNVRTGQHVEEGQALGDSNFTRDGTLALGKNLRVAYMAYHGLNSNDAVVISEGCARKLTSEHMYREIFSITPQTELSKEKHRMYYGAKYTPAQYASVGESGIVKKGSIVHPKDLLITGLVPQAIQGTDALLGRISKSLAKPFREAILQWDHSVPGEVVDVVQTGSQIAVLVKTQERMQVGDKLAGRYGNKGVVARIVPDHHMIRDEGGNPIDLIMTSAGVVSRINPAQVIETAVGKVAEKTGKPILFDNSQHKDVVAWAKGLLKDHGLKDKEVVFDPVHDRHIHGPDGKGVLVGRQYIYKLFKSTDTNFAGHGVGPYDLNEQPLKTGGEESAKGIGKMEFDALIAHNARNILHEASTIRGQKNDEFWKAIQLGQALPNAKPSFAFNKFTAMLEGAGIKVDKRGSKFKLLPLTDKDVLARSTGAIENSKTIIAKNLKPETGGLFDPIKTGGPQGTLYSHIKLHEPVVHPVFEEPVRRLLGWTKKQLDAHIEEKGGGWIQDQLQQIQIPKRLKELREHLNKAKGPDLNDTVKQIKYLEALQKEKLKPHEAYVISHVPVIPPVFRPILPQPHDPSQLMIADANKLYGHLMDANHVLANTVLPSDLGKHRMQLHNAVSAVYGTREVANDELRGQAVKGFLQQISGVGSPKGGFFQRKLMRRTQDVSGRGTAVPDGNLGMDEVGLPEDMLWKMFDKLIVARLIRTGYPALIAREMVEKRTPAAHDALMAETRERPVLINRAPTLHRYSIVASYAKPVMGKTIRVNPFIEKGMNLDYDGDTLQVHAPVTPGGIEDAKQMTMSNMLLSDQSRNKIMAFPQHEAVLGVSLASKATASKNAMVHKFKSREEALAAWRRGALQLTDQIEIEHEKHAEEDVAESWLEQPVFAEDALFFLEQSNVFGYDPESALDGSPS